MPSEAGESPRQAHRPESATGLRRRRLLAVGLLAVVAATAWGWRSSRRRDQENLLADARAALDRLRTPSATPIDPRPLVNEAEQKLTGYLAAGGKESASAELLQAVAQTLRSSAAAASPALRPQRSQTTADLLLAAEILFHANSWKEADLLLDEALLRPDLRAETLRVAATGRYDLGREDDVLAYCEELKRLEPEDARPWIVEARIHEDRSHWPQALEAYQEAVRREPGLLSIRWKLVEAQVRVGQAREAREALEAIPASDGSEDTRKLLEARILELEGRSKESLKFVDELLAKYPEHIDSLLLRGKLLLGLGRLQDSQQVFESLVRLDPTMQEAYYNLGQIYARGGDRAKGAEQLRIHRQLADKKLELYKLERQAGREPGNTAVRSQIADLYEQIGLKDLAEFWRRQVSK